MKKVFLIALTGVLFSCNSKPKTELDLEPIKKEILKAEEDFKTMAQNKGIAEAFYQFADDSAAIKRENDTVIKGKENIKSYYSDPKYSSAKVTWTPDFVSVSNDGSMAYTYGKYVWKTIDFQGKERVSKGTFHTVWKKQKDNSWKYVWD
ncbi:YybH family protein [Flavobacterium silvisoli]|nr:DUF4440 domain-containing protein [Flavobacterium silvisoli]